LVGPHLRQQFVTGDYPVALLDEIGQHLKDFGPEREVRPIPVELMALRIKRIIAKPIWHCPYSSCDAADPRGRPHLGGLSGAYAWAGTPSSSIANQRVQWEFASKTMAWNLWSILHRERSSPPTEMASAYWWRIPDVLLGVVKEP